MCPGSSDSSAIMEDVDRPETYLRLLAEQELRHITARGEKESTKRVRQAAGTLVAVRALTPATVADVLASFRLALVFRSGSDSGRLTARLRMLGGALDFGEPWAPGQDGPAVPPPRVVPLGNVIDGDERRLPFTLRLLTLTCLPGRAVISATASPLPPDDARLSAVDESNRPYDLRFHGTARPDSDSWHGVIEVSPQPSEFVRWLDIVWADKDRLTRLDLTRPRAQPVTLLGTVTNDPAERLLAAVAERLLGSESAARDLTADGYLDEIVATLRGAGLLADDSQTPGQLSLLTERLGQHPHDPAGHNPATLPDRWESVLSGHAAANHQTEEFAPLGVVLPEVDGARFALTGLSTTAGESLLHVAMTGSPRTPPRWGQDFSWWVRDAAGGWHVGTMSAEMDDWSYHDGVTVIRLTPPLPAPAGAPELELELTGPATQVRVTLPDEPPPARVDN